MSDAMTRSDILAEVWQVFDQSPRPTMFIRGTCSCEECMEHEAEALDNNLVVDEVAPARAKYAQRAVERT